MKKLFSILVLTTIFNSCDKKSDTNQTTDITKQETEEVSNNQETKADQKSSFNLKEIPVSTADVGAFPFINLPKGLEETNKPLVREFDICFFPIDGVMTPFEGKLYKTFVSPVRGEDFSQHYFEKSMADYLQSIGAVKVFDGEITKEEFERYNKQDPNKGGEGDMGYWDQNMKFWVLKTKGQGNIYIQYRAYNAGASLNVLQDAAFQQTITKVTADDIIKDLTENGKAILYINFDVDQSNITQEGNDVVSEIATALKKEQSLKISIEGHTDNSENTAHNKKLSENRAHAVMNKLTTIGIDKTRLSAKGFGSEQPLVANNTEENKAKNRRVELLRIN